MQKVGEGLEMLVRLGRSGGWPAVSFGECLHSCHDSLQSAESVPVGVGLPLKVCKCGWMVPKAVNYTHLRYH